MSKRLVEPIAATTEKEDTEKKQRPAVFAPKFFRTNQIQTATIKIGDRYKANDNKTRFIPPAVLGADNFEFMECMNPWGPDMLVLIHPPPGESAKDRFSLKVYRKTAEAKGFRVVYPQEEGDIEMLARETEDSFVIEGPDLELEIKGNRKERPGEAICRHMNNELLHVASVVSAKVKKVEAAVNYLFPEYVLQAILCRSTGQYEMEFYRGRDRISVIMTVPLTRVVTCKISGPANDDSVHISINCTDPAFSIDAKPVDDALYELVGKEIDSRQSK